jgi:hypothetical protein
MQHYPPGTQEDYNSFSSSNLIMGKGKELEFPEGWGGGKGRRSLCDLNLIARSAIGGSNAVRGFPLELTNGNVLMF